MADSKSKRRSRKRRGAGGAPRAVRSERRAREAKRVAEQARAGAAPRSSRLDARGERPESPFGGLPVSEFAILAGGVAVVVGAIQGGGAALIVGLVVCALAVLEVTAREHFSGYRSHALLLAAFPSVAIETGLVVLFGAGKSRRALLVAVVLPVFALLAWYLRRRYQTAHHARTVRAPRA